MTEPGRPTRTAGRWAVGGVMAAVSVAVVALVATSEISGTGAENVGGPGPTQAVAAPADCAVTASNPGGRNNYLPNAPENVALGDGFVIAGTVRSADGCAPLPGVRVQIWLATQTGSERDNRTSVRTDAAGRFRVETAPTVAQFGEPNIHVAYDDPGYERVFIRRVVDLDDVQATIDLTLQPADAP